MKTLYETILGSTKSGLKSFVWDKTKTVIDNVLNANSEFYMKWFLEGNNIRLDKDTVKKIVNKLKKKLPEGALFGMKQYGVQQIDKQTVEAYATAKFANPKYAFYRIKIEYGIREYGSYRKISQTAMLEFLIYLTEDHIYALDIPETKNILDELDTHFAKYETRNEVNLTSTYHVKSKLGGKYRVYSFKDLTKEFV